MKYTAVSTLTTGTYEIGIRKQTTPYPLLLSKENMSISSKQVPGQNQCLGKSTHPNHKTYSNTNTLPK